MTILRVARHVVIPALLQVRTHAPASAAVPPWYRAGGAPAPVAAYQPKGAATGAASYTNLANPGTYDAAPGTAPTFDTATGWTFDGTSQYLTTGIVHGAGWSALVRFSGRTNTGTLFGNFAAPANRIGITPYDYSGVTYRNGPDPLYDKAPSLDSGVLAVAGPTAYRNGSAETGSLGSWSGSVIGSLYIGAVYDYGVGRRYAGNIEAFVIYSATLDAAQVAAVTTAMAAL
jgi:hypothetical protein